MNFEWCKISSGVKMWFEEALRKTGFGVWKWMPPAPEFKRKNNAAGMSRLNMDNLWRIGTRAELVDKYNKTMKKTILNASISAVFGVAVLYFLSLFMQSFDPTYALAAILLSGLVMRYWTAAWGGYAGDWSDYEHDPVRMLTHNAYVLNEGQGMM